MVVHDLNFARARRGSHGAHHKPVASPNVPGVRAAAARTTESSLPFRPCRVYTEGYVGGRLTLIADWLRSLDQTSYEQVIAALELLRDRGPSLGRPLVDTITASRHRNMKELRPGSVGRSEVRILFAFDPKRMAILLIAGDKAGSWTRWYKRNVPLADDLFDEHIRALRKRPEQ